MFKIGDFSQLGRVTVRTLRHYDELGLLKPAKIDHESLYRFYTLEQLPKLNRIVALKSLGFSLTEIRRLVKEDVSVGELRGMLEQKQAEAKAKLLEEQERLDRIGARLGMIEHENAPLDYDVTIKRIPAMTVFSKRHFVPHISQMDRFCALFYEELWTVLKAQALEPVGSEFTLFHMREYAEENVDVEVAVVLESGDYERLELPDGTFSVRKLAGHKTVASVLHHGYYHEGHLPGKALALWAGMNGYESDGAAREVHLSGPIVKTGKDKPVVIEYQAPVKPHGVD